MIRVHLSAPDIGEVEEAFVLDALKSGWVAPAGPHIEAFETEMRNRVGVEHAVALASGTGALHLALVSWGVGPGDYVPVSTLTFAATANAVVYTGATPVFIDSDPSTGNMDPALLESAIEDLRSQGRRVPVTIPVDLLGKCADYEALGSVAEKYDVRILSDAAESVGASRNGIQAGAWGDAAVFSFNGNKIMTTSGGGMLLADDAHLAEHVRHLSTQAREPVTHYEHREIGFNYRMSNVLAALGRGQLSRLDGMLKRRRSIREAYATWFAPIAGVDIFGRGGDADDNCWLTALLIDSARTGWARDDLMHHVHGEGIDCRPLWKPMHLQPVFRDHPAYLNGSAESLFARGLSLPSGSSLTEQDLGTIESSIARFLESR